MCLRSIRRRSTRGNPVTSVNGFRLNLSSLLLPLIVAACGGGGSGGSVGSGSSGVTPATVVTIAPTSASVVIGTGSVSFSATVSNATDTGVTWQVNGATGGNTTVGTIATSGVYSAPATMPSMATVTVAAVLNADPTKSATAIVNFTQQPAPSVPTGLAASNVASTSVVITWAAATDTGGPGVGGYFVYRDGAEVATVSIGTSYTDSSLAPSTNYVYQVAAFDTATPPMVSALSASLGATTAAAAPVLTVPSGLTVSNVATGSVSLTWNASSDINGTGVGGYYVYRNGVQIATVTSDSYTDSPLSASTTYSYQIAAFDKASPASVSALTAAISVTTLADTQAPTVPTGLASTSIATGSVSLSWNASTDLPNPGSTGVGGYYVYRNGTQIATVTSTNFTDSPLTALTSYSYQVAAFDKATPANVSALSNALSVKTTADTQAPTVPNGLASSNLTGTSVKISWNASTDLPNPGATGVAGYYVYRNGTQIAAVSSGASYVDSGLTVLTNYSYRVSAFDKAVPANVSALSAALSLTTLGPITISPRNAALTLSQSQQFTTNAPSGTSLTWSVDGVTGGSNSLGTVSGAGLYIPPASAGAHTVSVSNSSYTASAAVAVTDLQGVTVYHNDLARTGQNLQEYALTPTSVSSGNFGKRWSCPLDGAAYAQPLYVANLSIAGGTHNVLFVATMHDSVYAFDADNPNCVTYWQVSFINPGAGITSTSSASAGCDDVLIEYGITGTPTVDPVAQTIYLVTNTTENGNVIQRLHALNLRTGADRTNSPVVIQATVPGNGDGGSTVTFNPANQNQRLALTLTGGGVLIGWSSHCDVNAWHGWMIRYDAASLSKTAVFNATPNGSSGGIWMSGGGPALDSNGSLFFSTGNGTFDNTNNVRPPLAPNNDFGESFVNLNPSALAVQDFYTPSHNASWSEADLDLSSSGLTVVPDGVGPAAHPNVLIGSDKLGHLWMIDRTSMSGYVAGADNTVQYLTLPNDTYCSAHEGQCVYSTPAYWSGTVYIAYMGGPLLALQLSNGLLPATAQQIAIASSQSAETYNYPSPTPSISASPSGGALVWTLDNNANGTDNGSAAAGPAILRAYDATNLNNTLYSSATRSTDAAGSAAKFTLPVVANGHVYVGGAGSLTVYALAP